MGRCGRKFASFVTRPAVWEYGKWRWGERKKRADTPEHAWEFPARRHRIFPFFALLHMEVEHERILLLPRAKEKVSKQNWRRMIWCRSKKVGEETREEENRSTCAKNGNAQCRNNLSADLKFMAHENTKNKSLSYKTAIYIYLSI